jgi:nucleoside triphosphate pyrophosphatase
MKLILASASPRRAEVLRNAGIAFEAMATGVDEAPQPNESPEELVRRLAENKARLAAPRVAGRDGPVIVVGADTEVVLDGAVLGKPASAEDARDMLRRLSGRTHSVITGLAAIRLPDGAARTELETTQVTFAPLTPEEVEDYVASGEPFDKAGAYAIQGRGGRFVTRVEGCYFNVVGLPLARLCRILRDLGWSG